MGKHLNVIIAIVIFLIVTAVCSNYFYRKGQEDTWAAAQQLVPLEKGEIYLCVERSDAQGVSYLTVEEISKASKSTEHDLRDLRFRLNLALIGMTRKEYYERYKNGKTPD